MTAIDFTQMRLVFISREAAKKARSRKEKRIHIAPLRLPKADLRLCVKPSLPLHETFFKQCNFSFCLVNFIMHQRSRMYAKPELLWRKTSFFLKEFREIVVGLEV